MNVEPNCLDDQLGYSVFASLGAMNASFVAGDTLKGNVDSMRSPRGARASPTLGSVKEASQRRSDAPAPAPTPEAADMTAYDDDGSEAPTLTRDDGAAADMGAYEDDVGGCII